MTLLSEPSSAWLRQGQALATAGSAAVRRERGVCISPPLVSPGSGLSSGSGTAANHYTSITRSQALTRLSQSLPPQATGNTSPAHPSHETPGYVLIVAYYLLLSLLGIFWFREISFRTLYCPGVKEWTCFGDRICLL